MNLFLLMIAAVGLAGRGRLSRVNRIIWLLVLVGLALDGAAQIRRPNVCRAIQSQPDQDK
jgi:hypothetical protein